MRRRLAVLFLVLGVAAAVAAAVRWWSTGREIRALASERLALDTELDSTRVRLRKEGLRYRGFLQGQSNIPDSLRLSEAGRSMEMTNVYRKTITRLEGEENRLVRLIRKVDAGIAAATAARRRALILPGALAAVLLAASALLRPRGVAP